MPIGEVRDPDLVQAVAYFIGRQRRMSGADDARSLAREEAESGAADAQQWR